MMNFFPLLSKISKISTLADDFTPGNRGSKISKKNKHIGRYFTPGDRGASQLYNDDKDSLSIMYNIQYTGHNYRTCTRQFI